MPTIIGPWGIFTTESVAPSNAATYTPPLPAGFEPDAGNPRYDGPTWPPTVFRARWWDERYYPNSDSDSGSPSPYRRVPRHRSRSSNNSKGPPSGPLPQTGTAAVGEGAGGAGVSGEAGGA
ncbi:hypothetical protein GTA08_BOTSDO01866 [Botryosphaeria dothidea]|uniref:Uncharacterized protein n=1 Tax=Botryosphaeria dothidea TaxID=55169 RepID=A0A8H4J021_9PEZI|nr:hypothetical protein GTA08_BOTSDO01866 [Botryosphaeria dothidea]